MVSGDGIPVNEIWPVVSASDNKNHTKVTCATYFWFNILILLNPAY